MSFDILGPLVITRSSAAPRGEIAGMAIVGELGRGTDTVVYRVRRHDRDYALKLVHEPRAGAEQLLMHFRREAALLASVDHPGLPRIHEAGLHGGLPYVVMDLVDGQSLTQAQAGMPMPAARVVAIAADIAGALAAIHHAGLVHRDIKPDNIMVLESGEAQLIDFGLAIRRSGDAQDMTAGTLAFASPEQAGTLNRPVDRRSDLYSLGVVMFAGVTGILPFVTLDVGELLRMHAVAPPPDPRTLVDGLGSGLATVILKLLAKDPDDRYQNGDQLLADLARLSVDPAAAFVAGTGAVPPARREPFVGRETEIVALVARWDRAAQGHGGACLIRGPGGAGKSRLAGELVNVAAARGVLVLQGKSSPDDAVPFGPLRAAIEGHLRAVAELPGPQREAGFDRLRAAAGPAAPLLGALSPMLGRLLSAGSLAAEDRDEQFYVAVAGFLVALARSGNGLVLLLDDVQWLDDSSRRVLHQLAIELADVPLLLVATARDDADNGEGTAGFEAALGAAIDLRQAPPALTDEEIALLVAARLPGIDAGAQLTHRLSMRGSGSPFVISEYLHAVVDAGLLCPSWGTWILDEEALAALDLPKDALGLVLARVGGLAADCRRVLTTAAVIGAHFRDDLLADVCGLDRPRTLELLTEAVERTLIERRDGHQYAFLHDRIREALLAELGEQAGAAVNEGIAKALDGDREREPAETYALAQHYIMGQRRSPDRVVAACLAAARLALDEHAPGRAIAFLIHAEKAGAVEDSTFLQLVGTALTRDGRHAEARERFERALTVESDPMRRADLYILLANTYRANWDTTGALEAVRCGLAEVSSPWHRNRVLLALSTIWVILASALVTVSRIGAGRATGRARERFSRICQLHEVGAYACIIGLLPERMVLHSLRSLYAAVRLGPSPHYVRAAGGLGLTLGALGLSRLAKAVFAPAIRAAEKIADPSLVADVASQAGAASFLGCTDDGQSWEQTLNEHGRWLDTGRYSDGVAAICWELGTMGRTEEALSWYKRANTRVLSRGAGGLTAVATFGAFALTLSGRIPEAAVEINRVDTVLAGHGGTGLRVNAVLTELHALVEQADFGARFDELVAEFDRFGMRPLTLIRPHKMFAVFVAVGRLAQCRAAVGDRRRARLADARTAVRALRTVANTPFLTAFLGIVRADLALLEGHVDAALTMATELPLTRRDAPIVAFEAARVRARALQAADRGEQARRQARLAQAIAVDHQWPQRERWIMAEFGLAGSPAGASLTGASLLGVGESVYRQRLRALEELGEAAARVVDPEALARITLDEIIRILAADRAFLFLAGIDETTGLDDGQLVAHLGRDGAGNDIDTPTAYSATLVERVRTTGTLLVVTGTEEGGEDLTRSVLLHGLRSIMAAPIQLEGRLMGVIYLDSRVAKGIFTPDDAGILTALTNHIAISFATARAAQLEASVQAARQQRDVAETLHQSLIQLSAEHDPRRVLTVLLDTASRILPCDQAWLLLRGEAQSELVGVDIAGQGRPGRTFPTDPSVDAMVDAATPILGGAPPEFLADALGVAGSWMALPLLTRDSSVGALILASARAGVYREAQVQLGSALAIQGVTACRNAMLFAQVQELATVDELTGIPNRRSFFDTAQREVDRARLTGQPLAAAMLDIDHFKLVNDTHGHAVGDQVIRSVAERLSGRLRATDTVGRYGGEEFAVLFPATERAGAQQSAEGLRIAVGQVGVDTHTGTLPVTVSVGVAQLRPDDDVASLLARADAALYLAKSAGRDRVRQA